MGIYKTIDVNKEENGGSYYPGLAVQMVLLFGAGHYGLWRSAYVKGDNGLFINDERFLPSMTTWYYEEDDIVEVTPLLNKSGIIRLPKEVFHKYFRTPTA